MIKTRQGGRAPTNSGAATQIINEVTANSAGQAINGYRETNSGGSTGNQVDCPEPWPAAVSTNFYYSAPTAAEADVCWPASGGGVVIPGVSEWSHGNARVPPGGGAVGVVVATCITTTTPST